MRSNRDQAMSEFSIKSESIDVERIMEQIRQRLGEKRNTDYTEEQIRELANVKLDRFADPGAISSNLVESYRKRLKERQATFNLASETPPTYDFDPEIVYRSTRGITGRVLYLIRKLARPFIKIFFNPGPILHALTVQREVNARYAEVFKQMVRTQSDFIEVAALNYEVMHNLVMEMTRLSIEMKNHTMRVESIAGRLDFAERRAQSLETVVQYRDGGGPSPRRDTKDTKDTKDAPTSPEGSAEKPRRRRRRGRRRPAASAQSAPATGENTATPAEPSGSQRGSETRQTPPTARASGRAETSPPAEQPSGTGDGEDPSAR